MKRTDVPFVVIASFVLTCVLANIMLAAAFPHSAVKSSTLEGRQYQEFPKENIVDGLASGDFQAQFERYLSDRVPARDSLLLGNACAQKLVIALSNSLFRFDAYPTFFGSDRVYLPDYNALCQVPDLKDQGFDQRMQRAAGRWKRVIDSSPNARWYVAIVDRTNTLAASPVAPLVSDRAYYNDYYDQFEFILHDSCNLIELSYDDSRLFFDDYFRTDHHWQVTGAARAYERIMQNMGKTPANLRGVRKVYDGPFYGSNARTGLTTLASDEVYDIDIPDSTDLNVKVNGKEKPITAISSSYSNKPFSKRSTFDNVYAKYFHTDYALIEFNNTSSANDDTLLIIGDSFTNCMERFFTLDYRRVYVVDPREYKEGVAHLIAEVNPSDIVVLMCASTFASEKLFL